MKITIESTTKIVELNGVKCRVWEGRTSNGIPVHCFICRVATEETNPDELAIFERELSAQQAPSAEIESWPLRMIL